MILLAILGWVISGGIAAILFRIFIEREPITIERACIFIISGMIGFFACFFMITDNIINYASLHFERIMNKKI